MTKILQDEAGNIDVPIEQSSRAASSPCESHQNDNIMDNEKPNNPLCQPEVIKALKELSPDVYKSTFQAASVKNASLVAAMLRLEGDNAQVAFELERPSLKSTGQSWPGKFTYEQEQRKNTPLGRLLEILKDKDLDAGDALTIFRAARKAYDGKERECGMELVKPALRSQTWGLRAIKEHPDLFRKAREKAHNDPKATALTTLINRSVMPSVEVAVEFIQALRATKIKETGGILINALLAFDEKMTDAFARVYGMQTMLDAVDDQGSNVLHVLAPSNQPEKLRKFLDAGVDPLARNKNNQTPLHIATANARLDNMQILLSSKAYPLEVLEHITYCPDKDAAALLQAAKAQLTIDAMRQPSTDLKPL